MSFLEELERHRAACKRCTPFAVCVVAANILERFALKFLPTPSPGKESPS